jgi:hypothetical protein
MQSEILPHSDDGSGPRSTPSPWPPSSVVLAASTLPGLVISGADGVPAIILTSGIAAALVLPILGRALRDLPEWGVRVVYWREVVKNSKR